MGSKIGMAVSTAYKKYSRTPVAYLDETYNVSEKHKELYYVVAAVIVSPEERDILRAGIENIAEDNYWHTTESRRTHQGQQKIKEMLEYLADGQEKVILSVHAKLQPGDKDGEKTRAKTLTLLLQELYNNHGVELCVLEKRRQNTEQRTDAHTKTTAVNKRIIPQSAFMIQETPSNEHLLWLPDLVASAYRQKLIGRSSQEFELIKHMTKIIEANPQIQLHDTSFPTTTRHKTTPTQNPAKPPPGTGTKNKKNNLER